MSTEVYLFILCLASIGLTAYQYHMHQKEKKGLYDRFMSKDFGEYKYFTEEYPKEVNQQEQKFKKEQKQKLSPKEILGKEIGKRF